MLGHPILVGDQFIASSVDDLMVRWTPKSSAEFITVAHPPAGTPEPDLTPVTLFGGYPVAWSSSGLIVADDQINPFFGSFANLTQTNWHMDISSRVGVPSTADNQVFTNVGGFGALASLVAVNSVNGQVQWEYAPRGLPDEPFDFIERTKPRAPTVEEEIAFHQARQAIKASGAAGDLTPPILRNTVDTPRLRATHGYWDNPGLVVVGDRVFGQVLGEVVALERSTGELKWSYAIPGGRLGSLAADKSHMFLSTPTKLIALDLASGKEVFTVETPGAGTITIGNGMLFLAIGNGKGGQLIAFATDKKD